MAVTYVASSAIGTSTVNPPTFNLTLPASIQADDIIVIQVLSVHISLPTNEINTPTGYTRLGSLGTVDSALGTDDFRYGVFWKRAVSGDAGATVTISRGGTSTALLCAVATVFRGADTTGSPFSSTTPAQQSNATPADNMDYPAYDPAESDVHVLYIGFNAEDPVTWPASITNGGFTFTRRTGVGTGAGADASLGVYSGDTAGEALAAVSHTTSAPTDGSSAGFVTALRPAGGGGGGFEPAWARGSNVLIQEKRAA